jgi:alkyl sulfatase BDS1-like metallo-beta-lactamase superfamily hydrolase
LTTLPFGDKEDFADATRGLIAKPDTLTIKDAHGTVVWDLEAFKSFIGVDKLIAKGLGFALQIRQPRALASVA